VGQRQRIAQFLQQVLLETAQRRGVVALVRQPVQRRAIVVEQLFVRIVARQQVQQQLVQVETAHQRRALQVRLTALPFGAVQRAHLALAEPGQQQRLEVHQHAAQRRPGPARAARHDRQPAVLTAEYVEDQAGLAERIAVQHEGGFVLMLVGMAHVLPLG